MPVLALTATATMEVRADILNGLGIPNAITFRQSFNRDNLRYEVRHKAGRGRVGDEIAAWIRETYKEAVPSGIVYCLRVKDCEDLAQELSGLGIPAAAYHGKMQPEDRAVTQRRWTNDEVPVVVATIAFGMGINKPDVRFVIHHSLPKSMEGYYQESGRAGRDGQVAHCILYYNYADKAVVERMIRDPVIEPGKPPPTPAIIERQITALLCMVRYCENIVDCRRVIQLQYFGETFSASLCGGTCDNCINKIPVQRRNVAGEAQQLVNLGTRVSSTLALLAHALCSARCRRQSAHRVATR